MTINDSQIKSLHDAYEKYLAIINDSNIAGIERYRQIILAVEDILIAVKRLLKSCDNPH